MTGVQTCALPICFPVTIAIVEWGDAGGYDIEVIWDTCCTETLGKPFEEVAERKVNTLSGGEQKKLVVRALMEGPEETLLLDEPDNYLDVPSKRWLERIIKETKKTVLFVSHDRELLEEVSTKIVALEQGHNGNTAWVHGGKFSTWHEARKARNERFAEVLLRWEQEHARLKELVLTLHNQTKSSPDMASKYRAMQTRLRKFEEVGPPPAPPIEQNVRVGLRGGRTGVRALTFENFALTGLTESFNFEVFYGDRIAVLGKNGSGKSHFLRLIGGDKSVKYSGEFKYGPGSKLAILPRHMRIQNLKRKLSSRFFGRNIRYNLVQQNLYLANMKLTKPQIRNSHNYQVGNRHAFKSCYLN